MAAVHLTIRGHVQGVGFRAFVHRTAMTLGVSGEVWNSRDGSVGVWARHDDANHLEGFVRILRDGPGRVEAIDVQPSADRDVVGFAISAGR